VRFLGFVPIECCASLRTQAKIFVFPRSMKVSACLPLRGDGAWTRLYFKCVVPAGSGGQCGGIGHPEKRIEIMRALQRVLVDNARCANRMKRTQLPASRKFSWEKSSGGL